MTASDGPRIVTREEWLAERVALLEAEKEFTRRGDELAAARRQLPWVEVTQDYSFDTEEGPRTLGELFDGRAQLIVYHFMFGAEWDQGCPSCSFWADNFNGVIAHLAARETTLVAVSTAPVARLHAYRKRMGWSFPWVSSAGSAFNRDYGVTYADNYNYRPVDQPMEESPGLSVFTRHDGRIFHTYSCYARGLDGFNTAYSMLDLTPKGRDEQDLPWSMAWLRRHDEY